MSRRRTFPWLWVAWFLTVGSAPRAHGDVAPLLAHVEYEAPAACPTALTFERAVSRRTSRVRLVEGAAAQVVARVSLRVVRGHVVGELRLRDLAGVEHVRAIEAPDCAQAVEALALITAFSLEHESPAPHGALTSGSASSPAVPTPTSPGSTGPGATGSTTGSATGSATGSTTGSAAAASATHDKTADPARTAGGAGGSGGARGSGGAGGARGSGGASTNTEAKSSTTSTAKSTSASPERQPTTSDPTGPNDAPEQPHDDTHGARERTERVSWYGLLGAVAQLRLAPSALVGPSLTVGVEVPLSTTMLSWRATSQLELSWSEVGGLQVPGGEAKFTLGLARLHLCPVNLGTSRWLLQPCLMGGFGALSSRGSNTTDGREHTRVHGESGLSLLSQLRVGPLLGQVAGGLAFPFPRDAYTFSPQTFFVTPAMTFFVGISAGVTLR